jgi:hypothetical protein
MKDFQVNSKENFTEVKPFLCPLTIPVRRFLLEGLFYLQQEHRCLTNHLIHHYFEVKILRHRSYIFSLSLMHGQKYFKQSNLEYCRKFELKTRQGNQYWGCQPLDLKVWSSIVTSPKPRQFLLGWKKMKRPARNGESRHNLRAPLWILNFNELTGCLALSLCLAD